MSDSSNSENSDTISVEEVSKPREFRQIRGQKIQQLLQKQNMEDEMDEFWLENKYFGKAEKLIENEEEDEEYEKEESIKDVFDSDFISEKESNDEENSQNEKKDENRTRSGVKRKFVEFSDERKEKKENKAKKIAFEKRQNQDLLERKYYIHDYYKQDELLREAAITELYNKKSLEDLVRLEEEKKQVNIKKKFDCEGDKIIFKDSIKSGIHKKTYYFSNKADLYDFFDFTKDQNNKILNMEIKEKKYCDPESKIRFNTIEEYKKIKKKNNKMTRKALKLKIKVLKSILSKKKELLETIAK